MGSLQVEPNVQEMVRSNPMEIPEKFRIRNPHDKPKSTTVNTSISEIPIIDLSLLSSGHKEELKKLDLACEQWGFFQLVNHGVEREVLQGMKDCTAKFFQLPLKEKNKFSVSLSSQVRQGYGKPFKTTEDQILDWSDALSLALYPSKIRNHDYWPTTPKGYKEAIEVYGSETKRVCEEVLRFISIAMGMEEDVLVDLHQESTMYLRVNHIPPCSMPDEVLGISSHADVGGITALLQDDDVVAFQILKNGEWISVKPIPNAFVMSVGDAVEIWSNGKYKSVEHRAVANKMKARTSYAFFIFPNPASEIEPLDHMLKSPGTVQMYKKIKYGDYLMNATKRKMEGKEHTPNTHI